MSKYNSKFAIFKWVDAQQEFDELIETFPHTGDGLDDCVNRLKELNNSSDHYYYRAIVWSDNEQQNKIGKVVGKVRGPGEFFPLNLYTKFILDDNEIAEIIDINGVIYVYVGEK